MERLICHPQFEFSYSTTFDRALEKMILVPVSGKLIGVIQKLVIIHCHVVASFGLFRYLASSSAFENGCKQINELPTTDLRYRAHH